MCLSKCTADGDDIEIIAGFLSFKPSREEAEKAMRSVHDSRPIGAKVEVFCDPTDFACEYARQREEQPTGYRFVSRYPSYLLLGLAIQEHKAPCASTYHARNGHH